MKYNGIEFEAIVATPTCGKSYLCEKYPDKFVDMDELKLKLKYVIPENISREELESTKGERTFPRRQKREEYMKVFYEKAEKFYREGKILIAAPHEESIEFFVNNNIKYCFIYPSNQMREEIKRRMILRGNPQKTVDENYDMFYEFYNQNINEKRAAVHYQFNKDEYLEDILKKFGCDF